jgi:hypothetical protein
VDQQCFLTPELPRFNRPKPPTPKPKASAFKRRPPPPIDTQLNGFSCKEIAKIANESLTPAAVFDPWVCPPEGQYCFRRGRIAL